MRSLLPVYLGLLMIADAAPLLRGATRRRLKVWWYFFLLFENRTIPAGMTLLAVLFFSTAGVLAHTLHERGLAPGALVWPAIDRRGPGRPSDEEWEAAVAAGRMTATADASSGGSGRAGGARAAAQDASDEGRRRGREELLRPSRPRRSQPISILPARATRR